MNSNDMKQFAIKYGFVIRTSSTRNKSNGGVETRMKLINWYLAKNAGTQRDIIQLVTDLVISLNSRNTHKIAGANVSAYGLLRGSAMPSIAERRAGFETSTTANLVEYVCDMAKMRGEAMKQSLERRGVTFAPEDKI